MRFLLALPLLMALSVAHAQPSPSQLALGQKLAELMQEGAMFDANLRECKEPKNSHFDPKVEFNSNPGNFGGLSPQSAYWPEVEAIYERFHATQCAYATPEKIELYIAGQYAEQINEDDLRAAIAFYSSPLGLRLQSASLRINESLQAHASTLMLQAYEVARGQFRTDISALLRKYKKEPK